MGRIKEELPEGQKSFFVQKLENKDWDKLKKFLTQLKRGMETGKIVNQIDNVALLEKILNYMEKME